jgi:hypothetical protein
MREAIEIATIQPKPALQGFQESRGYRIQIWYYLLPVPCSLFPIPYSLLSVTYSLFPIPYFLFPIACCLVKYQNILV